MGTGAVVAPSVHLDAADHTRLGALGISVEGDLDGVTDRPSAGDGSAPLADLAAAVQLGADRGALVAVGDRGRDSRAWHREGAHRLAAATEASATASAARPLALVLIPAASAPQPGPIVVLSPAESVSSYELYVGAALAAASGRRVEHLNGRGSQGSAGHADLPARAAARAGATQWRERAEPRPERALHGLVTRPAVIVVPVPPGSADAAAVIAAHADADVVLVFDAAHARYSATVAREVARTVELAFGVETSLADRQSTDRPARSAPATEKPVPAGAPAATERIGEFPAIRASDVIHVRLTDTTLELTNRTRHRVRLCVALGSAVEPGRARAAFETLLEPGMSLAEPTDAVADLAPPTRVLRHWSHGSAEVYEGGDRRLLRVEASVLAADGRTHASRAYEPRNGLDFSVTAGDLKALLGSGAARTFQFDVAPPRVVARAPRDLFVAFESALSVGTSILARSPS
ncbi:hypothetical protein AB0K00_17165 [Dactylosporangium sp. NPDC049525]|uniref:hypothetical protein n=1 Tax=Dactylosporangium sp. NPDC049525 TaxID=3154730 RepID=UPI003435CBB5